MRVEFFVPKAGNIARVDQLFEDSNSDGLEKDNLGDLQGGHKVGVKLLELGAPTARTSLYLVHQFAPRKLSPWSESTAKRVFDCACVLLTLPLLLPVLLITALAVRLTSAGPVFFLQKRVGSHGRTFTIFKFRTLVHADDASYHAVTTADNQPFTSIGPLLRRWKLDELPQIANVLLGDMSLVGPRPKMPEHDTLALPCRPGITGAATIAFAREETILDRVPKHHLNTYYHSFVLPAKRKLDTDYLARATFASDLKLIVNSVLRRWDSSVADMLPEMDAFTSEQNIPALEMEIEEMEIEDAIPLRVGAL